jgi:hypothetical protein
MNHPPLKIPQHLLKHLLNPLLVRHIALVRLELLPRKLLAQFLRNLLCVWRGAVEDPDIPSSRGDGAGDGETDASVAACDDVVLRKIEGSAKRTWQGCGAYLAGEIDAENHSVESLTGHGAGRGWTKGLV